MAYTGKSKFGAYDLDRVIATSGSVEKFLQGLPDNLRDNAAASLRSQMQDRYFQLGRVPEGQVQQAVYNRNLPAINAQREQMAKYVMPQAATDSNPLAADIAANNKMVNPGAMTAGVLPNQPTDQFALILQNIRNAITKRG